MIEVSRVESSDHDNELWLDIICVAEWRRSWSHQNWEGQGLIFFVGV